MGVPVFFKWLSTRNPKIIKDAINPTAQSYQSTGNPSIDNFYIDMNGLIHPSCNPKGENIKIPKDFEQQCSNIYEYIDKLMNIVRPRKTLYLAIDGVAPRAKMNQQRSRRFRAAMEVAQKNTKKDQLLKTFEKQGAWTQQLQEEVKKQRFDSNVITPGTQFLSDVCVKLREYIRDRLENHKQWKNLIVIFSDANCPGEGQHKIMDFIRQQRASASYTPNQSHCIYGADADLIMLGLATHQPKFYIIRQVVITAMDKYCTNCQRKGHYFLDCKSAKSIEDQARVARQMNQMAINVDFQFIQIQMVRQFVHFHFKRSLIHFGYDLERVIDDFVFLCFFVGNDFLPHVPCLSIREGGIDVLMKVYDYCLSLMPDYLTKQGDVNLQSLKIFITEISHYQQTLISQMIIRQQNNKQRQRNNRMTEQRQKSSTSSHKKLLQPSIQDQIDPMDPIGSFNQIMQSLCKQEPFDLQNYSVFNHRIYGYKEKYYSQKFKISPKEFLELKSRVSLAYVQALRWICGYYYKGVQSWSWFYPFHYSPFFTDITVPDLDMPPFELGMPFRPFEQLMAVLPPGTCSALPTFLHYYMKDINSPIIDYYPEKFHIDLVGKKFAWLGQVILPFIDDKRLLSAISCYQSRLTPQQSHRNRFGSTNMYINKYSPLGRKISKSTSSQLQQGTTLTLTWQDGHGVQGNFVVLDDENDGGDGSDGEILGFGFDQPVGRMHCVKLGEGTLGDPDQIDEVFVGRTDRAAFGGLRYLKIIEGVMFTRRMKLRDRRFGTEEHQKQDRNQGRYGNRSRPKEDHSRSRSRQKAYNRANPQEQKNQGQRRPHHHNNRPYQDREDRYNPNQYTRNQDNRNDRYNSNQNNRHYDQNANQRRY